jgi:hypothetical protein
VVHGEPGRDLGVVLATREALAHERLEVREDRAEDDAGLVASHVERDADVGEEVHALG